MSATTGTDGLVQLVQIVCGTAGGDGEMMVDGLRWSQQPSAASFTSLDLSSEIFHLSTHTLSTLCSLPSEIGLKYTCESTCSHTCDFRIPKVYNIPLDFGDCVAAPKPKQEV